MRHALLGATLTLGLLAGCNADRNGELSIGDGAYSSATLDGARASAIEGGRGGVVSVTRTDWDPLVYVVPLDTTAGGETFRFREDIGWSKETARREGSFPSAEDAVDTAFDGEAEFGHALASPFVAAAEVAVLPFLFLTGDAFETHESPRGGYERAARSDTDGAAEVEE